MSERIEDSRFWKPLWLAYGKWPSMALCRVPEVEYASRLDVSGRVLDHCCGDGLFAQLAWSGQRITAGCDRDWQEVSRAKRRVLYRSCDVCDASEHLPYADGAFDLVFNNSAIEHIPDLDATLAEVARVITPGGTFAFNVLNRRYFDWWPLGDAVREAYREWQPFFHALDLEEWRTALRRAGLEITSIEGYFDESAARELAWLDCEFSGALLGQRGSRFVRLYRLLWPVMNVYWRRRLAKLVWRTAPDEGAGYFIKAVRG